MNSNFVICVSDEVAATLSFDEEGVFLTFTDLIENMEGKTFQLDKEGMEQFFVINYQDVNWYPDLRYHIFEVIQKLFSYLTEFDKIEGVANVDVMKFSSRIEIELKSISDFKNYALMGGDKIQLCHQPSIYTLMRLNNWGVKTNIILGQSRDRGNVREVRCPWNLLELLKWNRLK